MKNTTRRKRRQSPQLRKLHEQILVITGATSGIGLATARLAAQRGARLVLVARNEQALQQLHDELRAQGAEVVTLAVDVADADDMQRIEQAALEQYGGFDTWINNAAVSMYGPLLDVPLADEQQLFETNYWGMVNGVRVAARHLRQRGGAIINVASTNAETSAPLQGTYSASQHAIKGYTDALRMELEAEGAPVAVTLVKPGPVDTPFTRHARNHMNESPQLTPPVYAPSVVAEAILFCAEHPRRDITVGGGGRMFSLASKVAPRLTDRVMSTLGFGMQKSGRPVQETSRDSLYRPAEDLEERGGYSGHVMKSSIYTKAALRPARTGALIVASGVVAGLLWRAHRKGNGRAQLNRLAEGSEKTAHRVARKGRKLEQALARGGRKVSRGIPRVGRSIREGVERNLPHR